MQLKELFFVLFSPYVVFQAAALSCRDSNPCVIHQFPNGTFVENIAVRHNGRLLVTLVNTPELWEVDPFSSADPIARRINHFNGHAQATGIAEIRPDVFTVSADDSVYVVDMNTSPPQITFLVSIQDTTLNGMAYVPEPASKVLTADTSGGVIWSIDLATKAYNITLWDETMFPVPGARRSLVGVNGIRYNPLSGYLHYVNLPKELYYRVLLDPITARATGPYEEIAESVMADDFALENETSVAYLASLDRNVITKISLGGHAEIVAGSLNSSLLAGPTSAAFGRTESNQDVLYITTGGGITAPVNGTYTEGGKIVALRV